MERRSRSWALGLSFIGFFALLFSIGFVQQVQADDAADYGTVIGIVCCSSLACSYRGMLFAHELTGQLRRIWAPHTRKLHALPKFDFCEIWFRSMVQICALEDTVSTRHLRMCTGQRTYH